MQSFMLALQLDPEHFSAHLNLGVIFHLEVGYDKRLWHDIFNLFRLAQNSFIFAKSFDVTCSGEET